MDIQLNTCWTANTQWTLAANVTR